MGLNKLIFQSFLIVLLVDAFNYFKCSSKKTAQQEAEELVSFVNEKHKKKDQINLKSPVKSADIKDTHLSRERTHSNCNIT